MTIPKLYLYKAQNANTVVILRRGETRDMWEMIRWDVETDTFTEGQWLLKKQMNGKYAAISPCGNYFAYHYDVYGYVGGEQNHMCHGVVSKVPNFTALYFNELHHGNWESIDFTEKGEIVAGNRMTKKGEIDLKFVDWNSPTIPSGYIDAESWTDPKGRQITHNDGILFADNHVLYDTTDHVFVPREPV